MSRRARLGLLIGALLLVVATHFQITSLELRTDDYATLRPWTAGEVREAIVGSWSGTRAFQDQYHRPLTGLYHAALFAVFGVNAPALHALSLAELVIVVWLLALFLRREARSGMCLIAVAVYVLNPLLRDSTSAWIFNQFHLIACMVVVLALLAWQRRRDRVTVGAWAPIFALAAIGWYVKEDTVMVLPALLAYQAMRARQCGDVPPPSMTLLIAASLLLIALVAVRFAIISPFDALTGREPFSLSQMAFSIAYGLGRPFFARAHQQVAILGTATLLGLGLLAVSAMRRRPASVAGQLALLGAVLLTAFTLPLMFQPGLGTTRVHLVVLASTIMLAGGAMTLDAWLRTTSSLAIRTGLAIVLVAGGVSLHIAALGAQSDLYAPCAPVQLTADVDVALWPIVAPDVRAWLGDKARQCAARGPVPIRATTLRWPVDGGWTLLVPRHEITTTVRLANTDASPEHPRDIDIVIAGIHTRVRLDSARPTAVTIPLPPSLRAWLRAAHRIDMKGSEPFSTEIHSFGTQHQ